MTIGSLFSGIGGLELGLERAGLGPVQWQAEIDPFCREVLERHWPDAKRYERVEDVGVEAAGVDVVCGGFPCQPHSVAGKRRGTADSRWLWPEFERVIGLVRPAWVVIENVPALRTSGLRDVLADLAALGFDAEWTCLGAFEVGAPHIRRRLFLAASDPERAQLRQQPGWLSRACESAGVPIPGNVVEALVAADPDGVRRLESSRRLAEERGWARHCGWSLGEIARVGDGVSRAVDRRRALGNAVVPAVAEVIGRAMVEVGQ